MAVLDFHDEPLVEIQARLAAAWRRLGEGDILEVTAPDPDLDAGLFEGEMGPGGRRRSFQLWCDLAEVMDLQLLTPRAAEPGRVTLRFRRPVSAPSPHDRPEGTPVREKYGADSVFARVDKREEPHFLDAYGDAVRAVDLPRDAEILAAGVNRGDELAVLTHFLPAEVFQALRITGVDHCASALDVAAQRFPKERARFLCLDLKDMPADRRYDLILCHGTLQSPGVNGKQLIGQWVKTLLKPGGSLILSFPNCRYEHGATRYGARVKNYRKPEFSNLVNDLAFFKKYLQKARFRVTLTGKYDLFLTATPA